MAPDGKRRITDCLTNDGVIMLAKEFPGKKANRFIKCFIYSDETIDGKSKAKAYALFGSSLLDEIEVGTTKGLQQIHGYLFGGLYDFTGQIRTLNIAKDGFQFAMARFFPDTLRTIEKMPETTFDEIVAKYVEMNGAHSFMEGNGRSTRIWLDLILKKTLKLCVGWSLINKKDYLAAMEKSAVSSTQIKALIQAAAKAIGQSAGSIHAAPHSLGLYFYAEAAVGYDRLVQMQARLSIRPSPRKSA